MPNTRRHRKPAQKQVEAEGIAPGAVLVALSERQWLLIEAAAAYVAEVCVKDRDICSWAGHPLELFGRTARDRWKALAELRVALDAIGLAYPENGGAVYAGVPRLRMAALVLSLYTRELMEHEGDVLASLTANQPKPARGQRLHIPPLPTCCVQQAIGDAALAGAAVQSLEVALRAAGDPLPPPTSPRVASLPPAEPTAAGSAAIH